MAKEIDIIIETNGETSIELTGWHGKGCSDVTAEISKALGRTVKTDKKCEYWQQETKPEVKQKVKR